MIDLKSIEIPPEVSKVVKSIYKDCRDETLSDEDFAKRLLSLGKKLLFMKACGAISGFIEELFSEDFYGSRYRRPRRTGSSI